MRRLIVGAVLVLVIAGCSAAAKSVNTSNGASSGTGGPGASSLPKCSKWFSEGADPSTYAASSECIDSHGAVAEYQVQTVNCFDRSTLTWTTVGWWNQTNKFHVFKAGQQQPPTLVACGS